jgi:hypothetical protein
MSRFVRSRATAHADRADDDIDENDEELPDAAFWRPDDPNVGHSDARIEDAATLAGVD